MALDLGQPLYALRRVADGMLVQVGDFWDLDMGSYSTEDGVVIFHDPDDTSNLEGLLDAAPGEFVLVKLRLVIETPVRDLVLEDDFGGQQIISGEGEPR